MMNDRRFSTPREKGERRAVLPYALTDVQIEAIGRETGEPGWMIDLRRSAFEAYRSMPSPADEGWQRGDSTRFSLAEMQLEALTVSAKPKRVPAAYLKPAAGVAGGGQLVLEDRKVNTLTLDHDLLQAGVIFQPLAQAARDHPDLVRTLLGSVTPLSDGAFAALATILADTGFFLYVPKGIRIVKPLHTLLWSSGEGLRAWRLLVNVEEGAEVSLFHECASPQRKEAAARLDLLELIVHRDATLRFFMTQSWGSNVVRIDHEKAVVHRNGRLNWGFAHIGARSTRTYSTLELKEEGASAKWSGLNLLAGDQQLEISTTQKHLAPRTTSDFLCKGVLAGAARSSWKGMTRIEPGAGGADGYQGNRTLILSDQAKVEAIPGLEILSDDVRCSHGVTIGELDPEELFYLRSRGISEEESKMLLVMGFLESVLDRLPEEELRQRVHLAVDAKMKTMEAGQIQDETTVQAGELEGQGAIS